MNVPIPTDYDPESPNQTVYDLPRGTGFLKGPTTGGWVPIGSPQPEPGPFDQIGKLAEQAYATMPAQEAEAAVASAIQFQGLRGYNRDMQSGKSANEAIAKWGPAMFYRSPQTLAQVMKANQPAVQYTRTPGTGGAPTAWTAPGKAPVFEPRAPSTLQHVGDALYDISGPTPKVVVPSPERNTPEQARKNALDQAEFGSALSTLKQSRKTLFDPNADDAAKEDARNELRNAGRTIRGIRGVPLSQAAAVSAPEQDSGKRVRVKSPSGKVGTIPESQLSEARKAGYTVYAD